LRIQLSFDWEQTRLDMQRLTGTVDGVQELMESFGFKRIPVDQGFVWAPPGMNTMRLSVSLDAAAIVKEMERELAVLLARTINKMKPGGDQ
jgi:hypothetical protein